MKRDTQTHGAFIAALFGVALIGGGLGIRAFGDTPVKEATADKPSMPAAMPALEKLATAKIKDLTCTLTVDSDETNFDELKKIGGAFAATYRIKHVDVTYEQPNKVRFESSFLGASVVMIYNGGKKVYHTPIKSGESDVSNQPGQKQSLLDLGIYAADYMTSDYKPIFLRKEGNLLVIDIVQRYTGNKSHEIVWLNPKTFITERRQSFNGSNIFKKELRYKNATQFRPGIWVPTRIEIYNQFGVLGAVQNVEDVKVNLGVDEKKFDVS